jgi:hypothetical protein
MRLFENKRWVWFAVTLAAVSTFARVYEMRTGPSLVQDVVGSINHGLHLPADYGVYFFASALPSLPPADSEKMADVRARSEEAFFDIVFFVAISLQWLWLRVWFLALFDRLSASPPVLWLGVFVTLLGLGHYLFQPYRYHDFGVLTLWGGRASIPSGFLVTAMFVRLFTMTARLFWTFGLPATAMIVSAKLWRSSSTSEKGWALAGGSMLISAICYAKALIWPASFLLGQDEFQKALWMLSGACTLALSIGFAVMAVRASGIKQP